MEKNILNKYEEKGLSSPFIILRSGETFTSQKGEALKNEISQMATVIFETINTIGTIKINTIEIMGNKKGIIMELEDEKLVGSLFDRTEDLMLDNLWTLIGELRDQPSAAVALEEKPKAKKIKLELDVLEKIKAILKDYLGDFTERVYQNQLKIHRIQPDDFYDEDARRFIFALGKAAGMIIGPSKGTELTNKLLNILK